MNRETAVIGISATLSALFAGMALQGVDLGQQPWFVSRASGLVAFTLLSSSVVLGLLMSTKLAKRLLRGRAAYDLHTFLSVLTLVFLGLHGGALLFDGFFHFTPAGILVPFMSPYAPLWVGLGVIGGWATAIVSASTLVKKQIGYRSWRRLHYVAFVAYVLSLVHGVTAGSDTGLAGVQLLYASSGLSIAGLLAYRILARGGHTRQQRPAAAAMRRAA